MLHRFRTSSAKWNSPGNLLGLLFLVGCFYPGSIVVGQTVDTSAAAPNRSATPTEQGTEQETDEPAHSANGERDQAFRQMLEKTVWTGRFTILERADQPLVEERYEIRSVEKMDRDDFWKIEARVKYGDRDFTMPFAVQVKWAGNTPVITVDKLFVPGMGTFDARVLLRNNQYAGTWAHDDVRGHMFGTFRKAEKPVDDRP